MDRKPADDCEGSGDNSSSGLPRKLGKVSLKARRNGIGSLIRDVIPDGPFEAGAGRPNLLPDRGIGSRGPGVEARHPGGDYVDEQASKPEGYALCVFGECSVWG